MFPCAIEMHFITRHARLHTQMIFFLLSNIVDFICKNNFQKAFLIFNKPHLWPNKWCKCPTINIFDCEE